MVKQETSDGLPPDEIIRRIEKALVYGGGTHTLEDVRQGLIEGKFQIFWNEHGVCITEIIQSPQSRHLHCFLVAGELPGVMELQEQVIRHAITNSCAYMTTAGRFGWQKVLPKFGWKKAHIAFKFDLEGMV